MESAWRIASAAILGNPIYVPVEIELQRQMICAVCEENKAGRCVICGCGVSSKIIRKTNLAQEQCPLPKPKWERWKPTIKTA